MLATRQPYCSFRLQPVGLWNSAWRVPKFQRKPVEPACIPCNSSVPLQMAGNAPAWTVFPLWWIFQAWIFLDTATDPLTCLDRSCLRTIQFLFQFCILEQSKLTLVLFERFLLSVFIKLLKSYVDVLHINLDYLYLFNYSYMTHTNIHRNTLRIPLLK